MYTAGSSLFSGVGEDARYIVDHMVAAPSESPPT